MQQLIAELTQLESERPRHSHLRSLAVRCGFDGKRLAPLCNVSPRQLQRVFSASLARSPQAWLNEQRLIAAREMLLTAKSVKEVAGPAAGARRPPEEQAGQRRRKRDLNAARVRHDCERHVFIRFRICYRNFA